MRQTRQWVSMRCCPLRPLGVMILAQPMVGRRWLALHHCCCEERRVLHVHQ
jgi:hypothetical protein